MANPVEQYKLIMEQLEELAQKKDVQEFIKLATERDRLIPKAKDYVTTNEKDNLPFIYGTRTDVNWDAEALRSLVSPSVFKEITEVVVCKESLVAAIKKGKISEDDIDAAKLEKTVPMIRGGVNPWKIQIKAE
jgi:hypothetical protein